MAGGFSPQLLEEIRARVDIVDLVGQFVNLKRAGENWKGLCPFHAEKTPSFMVHPKKGIFHCFGCGVGGDAFGFLMRQDRLQFPEAVRVLAERAGVALPTERRTEGDGQREALFKTMAQASEFYRDALWNRPEGEGARRYLDSRGIAPEMARRFVLGYAPEGWDHLLGFMKGRGVTEEQLVQVGLVLPRQTGSGFYDRFRGRLLFPIKDGQGRIVAFGGRAMGTEDPKYLNSPETPLYVKGQTLYAFDLAKPQIREKNRALVVEGYVDCLMAHQHGFTETVAALGTAFTASQLGLLRRYCDEVITFFDADAAGKKATQRVEELLEPGTQGLAWAVNRTGTFGDGSALRLKVALLPSGHDPDSFLRKEGAQAFTQRIGEARSLLAYAVETAIGEENTTAPRGKATAFARVALILAKVTDSQEATELARDAALKLGVDPTQLWIEAQRLQGALRKPAPATAPAPAGVNLPSAERDLVSLLVQNPDVRAALLPVLVEEDLAHPALRAILAALKTVTAESPEALMPHLPGDTERGLLAALLVEERAWPDTTPLIAEYLKRFEMRRRARQIRQVSQAIAQAQASGDPALPQLQAQLSDLQRQAEELRELAARPN
ncbi:MAG: DNA primase [Candidatus Rokubacteria bacterium RIFCSPLOWO2_02_FULL_68_19]|nr:MAG: DNA primase [Candidatus Rokubacteria bacterium RIFCSPLOWO2_02_FULL_68_19]